MFLIDQPQRLFIRSVRRVNTALRGILIQIADPAAAFSGNRGGNPQESLDGFRILQINIAGIQECLELLGCRIHFFFCHEASFTLFGFVVLPVF